MKIAYFSDFFYPQIGGTQDSVRALGQELGRRGHEIYYYVPYYSKKHYQVSGLPPGELNLGEHVRIFRLASVPGLESVNRSRIIIPNPLHWFKVRRNRPDIIHTQSFWTAGLEAVFAAKTLGLPLVGTNHLSAAHYKIMGGFYYQYVVWFYNHCNYVTAPSAWSFKEMMPHGLTRPHRVISNPIDTGIFNSVSRSKRELKKRFNLSKKTIVFGGRLAPEKNVDVIIKALPVIAKQIPDIELALAGRGSEEENLKNLAVSLSVEDKIRFLGNLNKADLADLFVASEIFVLTSTSETQNMVMLQAMASGLPVVAVRAQALPEYINSNVGLLIEAGDYKALAEKVIFLLMNPKNLKALGRGGKKYVDEFSVANIADEWEDIYKKVIYSYYKGIPY